MATIIVGHEGIDLDCAVSMLALEAALREVVKFRGEIKFVLIRQGTTYKGIKVHSENQYEVLDRDRIYHVDCGSDETGRGFFDHHRAGCNAPSSAVLIDQAFGLSERLPEWERMIEWATRADQGNLGGCTIAGIITAMHVDLGEGHDAEIFRLAKTCIRALLTRDRRMVAANKFQQTVVPELQVPEHEEAPSLQVEEIFGFGNIGLIVGPEKFGGSFRNQLEGGHRCRLIISFDTEKGKVGIMSRFPPKDDSPEKEIPTELQVVDLRELGIVYAIREAEDRERGVGLSEEELSATGDVRGMKWFAHEVEDGRVANLFNGSAKVDLKKGEETRLPWEQIIKIVKDRITKSIATEE